MRKWNGYYHISVSTGKPEKCHAQSPDTCPFGMDSPHSTSEDELMEEVQRLGKQESGGVLAGYKKKMTKKEFDKKLEEIYEEADKDYAYFKPIDILTNLEQSQIENLINKYKNVHDEYDNLMDICEEITGEDEEYYMDDGQYYYVLQKNMAFDFHTLEKFNEYKKSEAFSKIESKFKNNMTDDEKISIIFSDSNTPNEIKEDIYDICKINEKMKIF